MRARRLRALYEQRSLRRSALIRPSGRRPEKHIGRTARSSGHIRRLVQASSAPAARVQPLAGRVNTCSRTRVGPGCPDQAPRGPAPRTRGDVPHAAGARRRPARVPGRRRSPAWHRDDEAIGRSRVDSPRRSIWRVTEAAAVAVLITPGQWGDAPQTIPVLDRVRVPRPAGGHPRTRPDHLCGDKAYSSRRNRRYLWGRQIRHTVPERRDQQAHRRRRGSAGGRPTGFTGTGTHAGTKSNAP